MSEWVSDDGTLVVANEAQTWQTRVRRFRASVRGDHDVGVVLSPLVQGRVEEGERGSGEESVDEPVEVTLDDRVHVDGEEALSLAAHFVVQRLEGELGVGEGVAGPLSVSRDALPLDQRRGALGQEGSNGISECKLALHG